MRKLLFLLLTPYFCIAQVMNKIDENGKKQGDWSKKHKNGEVRYKGQFKDNVPQGLFLYYYKTGELQIEKKFFNNGEATAAHFFYKNGGLQSSGLYVSKLKDSTWNFYNHDSILVLSEEYTKGKLNGKTKTFYYFEF